MVPLLRRYYWSAPTPCLLPARSLELASRYHLPPIPSPLGWGRSTSGWGEQGLPGSCGSLCARTPCSETPDRPPWLACSRHSRCCRRDQSLQRLCQETDFGAESRGSSLAVYASPRGLPRRRARLASGLLARLWPCGLLREGPSTRVSGRHQLSSFLPRQACPGARAMRASRHPA
jgi:hypothetical protein